MALELSSLLAAGNEQLLKLVDRRHPEYKDNVEHWRFLESSYRGGRDWIEKNLFTYTKEGNKEFEERKKRAFRFPHSKQVVTLVNKYVFKGAIERKEAPPAPIKEFWGASTLLKRPITDLMETISLWSSAFGRIWVVVDNNVPPGVKSEAERKAAKGRCYAYFLKPTQAYDFAYDDDGELEWFMNGEFRRDDSDPLNSTGEVEEVFRIWTKQFTCVIRVKVENNERTAVVDKSSIREHNMGIVPVFPADHITSDELYKVDGLIEDVAYMDRTVVNYLSCLDVIITDQTFSQLAIPFQGMLPTEGGSDEDPDNEEMTNVQVMGTKRVFAYNAEGGAAPQYISPDVAQPEMILKAVTKIVGEIYHSIGMAGERTKEDNATGIDNSSGVAKAYDFERLNAMLAAKARALQNVERNIVRLVNAWSGEVKELQETEELVTYPQTFDVRNLADEMDNAQRMSVMNAPKKLRRFQMKRVARKMFPQASEAEINEIIKDIEEKWLEEPELGVAAGLPTLNKGAVASRGPVPGKGISQGETNKGSVKAEDKAAE